MELRTKLNLALIATMSLIILAFVARTKAPVHEGWTLPKVRAHNTFVQHPAMWLMGNCYGHEDVVAALHAAGSSLNATGTPVVYMNLSPQDSTAPHAGRTIDVLYTGSTRSETAEYTRPALLTWGYSDRYAADGTKGDITFDAGRTLAVINAFTEQDYAPVTSILVAPHIKTRLIEAATVSMPLTERLELTQFLKTPDQLVTETNVPTPDALAAFMQIRFGKPE